jgi:hypothetical protein
MSEAQSPQLKMLALLRERQRREQSIPAARTYARRLGLFLDNWQAEVMATQSRRAFLLCSRQSGKSTIAALRALREASTRPDSTILIVAPTQRQSVELLRKVAAFAKHRNSRVPTITRASLLTMEFSNKSRIVGLPGNPDNVRGYSNIRLLIADEACFLSDDIHNALSPMLAVSNGQLLACSTPWLAAGWAYDAYTNDPEYQTWTVPATEIKRIKPEFLAGEQRRLGAEIYGAEYLCQFLSATKFGVFNAADLERSQLHWQSELDWSDFL